jgi:bacterioferritin-associated ferredoxin
MYVCICNAIRECELRSAAKACAGDVDAVYAALGKEPLCGQCLDEAMHVMIDERESARTRRLLPSP